MPRGDGNGFFSSLLARDEPQRQRYRTAQQHRTVPILRRRRAFEIWKAPQQRAEHDLGLEAGQLRPQAEMIAVPEGQMAVVRAADVQTVWIFETGWIAVRTREDRRDELTRHDPLTADLTVFDGRSIDHLNR